MVSWLDLPAEASAQAGATPTRATLHCRWAPRAISVSIQKWWISVQAKAAVISQPQA